MIILSYYFKKEFSNKTNLVVTITQLSPFIITTGSYRTKRSPSFNAVWVL